jgi:hypothetical protein
VRRPSRWMRDVHVVLFWNADMASLSVAPGSSVHRLEKHRMYSRRFPSAAACSAQLPLLAGAHVSALKVADEDPTRSVQSLILFHGRCSS